MQQVILNDSTKSMGQNLTGLSQATRRTGEKQQVKVRTQRIRSEPPRFETLVDFGNVHDQTIIEELQEYNDDDENFLESKKSLFDQMNKRIYSFKEQSHFLAGKEGILTEEVNVDAETSKT